MGRIYEALHRAELQSVDGPKSRSIPLFGGGYVREWMLLHGCGTATAGRIASSGSWKAHGAGKQHNGQSACSHIGDVASAVSHESSNQSFPFAAVLRRPGW